MSIDKLHIQAIIPDGRNPEAVVVGPDGELPGGHYDPERHRSWESPVHELGRKLGERALSVARREGTTAEGGIVYRTDPAPDLQLPGGYSWVLRDALES